MMRKPYYVTFFIFAQLLLLSCNKENEDLIFLRPDQEKVIKKIKNGEIVEFGNDGLRIWLDHEPKFVCEGGIHGVCFERWIFDLNEFTQMAIDSVIRKNSTDDIRYLKLIDENDIPTNDHFATFKIVNNDYNNFEFYGSVFCEEGINYKLTLDYFYPNCVNRTIKIDGY